MIDEIPPVGNKRDRLIAKLKGYTITSLGYYKGNFSPTFAAAVSEAWINWKRNITE